MKISTSRRGRALALAGTVLAALALSSCSGSAGGGGGAVTLEFYQSGDVNQGGGYAALAKKYEKETGVKVDVVEVPGDDLRTRLRTAAQANDLPALAAAPDADPAWTERMLDLTDVFDKANIIDTLAVRDPADDKVKALPTTLTAVGMFINKSAWDAAGVSYPTTADAAWTWDEFVAAAQKVVDSGNADYGAVMDNSAHRLRSFLYEFGSQGVAEQSDGTYALDKKGAEALKYFKDLNDSKFMPSSVWVGGDDASAVFKSGRVAAYISGVWQIADFQANITDFEWASVPLPKQPVQATNYGAASWIVGFDGTGVEKETKAFIKWLYEPAQYTEYCEISGCLPVEKDLKITRDKNADSFALYEAEIAASPKVSAVQTTSALKNSYLGKSADSEPLKDETVKYLSGQQSLEDTVAHIDQITTEQLAE